MKSELIIAGKKLFGGKEIPVILGGFGENKKCMSDKTIAEIHSMREPDIRRRITDNIKRFKENIDFLDLKSCASDAQQSLEQLGYTNMQISKAEHIYLLSERGYSKLIKIMDTDLAWEVHDKIMDEYFQLREEQKPLSQLEILQQSIEVLNRHEEEIKQMDNRMDKLEFEIPLYGSEADELSSHVKRKGVAVLGGKNTESYRNNNIRSKIYRDIYDQIRREFGLYGEDGKPKTYKALKRKYINKAHEIVDAYEAPLYLQELIRDANAQINLNVA